MRFIWISKEALLSDISWYKCILSYSVDKHKNFTKEDIEKIFENEIKRRKILIPNSKRLYLCDMKYNEYTEHYCFKCYIYRKDEK